MNLSLSIIASVATLYVMLFANYHHYSIIQGFSFAFIYIYALNIHVVI